MEQNINEEEAIIPNEGNNELYENFEVDPPNISSGESKVEKERDKYLNDSYEDTPSKKRCFRRYFDPIRAGSLRGATISLAALVFGISGFYFPKGIDNLGLIPGLIILSLFALFAYWTLCMLLDTARKKKMMKYGPLINLCLGKKFYLAGEINNIIYCIGILMSLEFTISSFFMDIISLLFEIDEKNKQMIKLIQVGICMCALQIPLSLLKKILALQYASIVQAITLIYSTLVVLIQCGFYYNKAISDGYQIPWFQPFSMKFFDSFSIMLYGFSSHTGIFPIFDELAKPSKRRSYKVLRRGYLSEVIVFLLIGLGGFFSLVNPTPSIFLSRVNLPYWGKIDYFILISKILFLITLHGSLAIYNNILRNSIKSLAFDNKDLPCFVEYIGFIGLAIVTNLITFFISDVLKIISIIGGICTVIICYLAPILAWVKTNDLPRHHLKNIIAIILLIITSAFGLISAGYSIYVDIKGEEEE